MKKMLLIFIAMCLQFTLAFGQVEQGTKSLGGGIGYTSSDFQGKTSYLGLNLNAIYFFADNFGGGLSFQMNKTFFPNSTFTRFAIDPFVRFYLGKSQLKPFVTAGVGYDYTSTPTTDDLGTENFTLRHLTGFLGAGAEYFPSKYLGIAATMQLDLSETIDTPISTQTFFTIGFNMYIP